MSCEISLSTNAVECHFDVGEISKGWQFCDMKNATKYLGFGSFGILMMQWDNSGWELKG